MSNIDDIAPVLVWFRRDLRLADNPALTAAIASGRPIVCLYVLDPETPYYRGSAGKRWLQASLRALRRSLEELGNRLIVRQGPVAVAVTSLAREIGAAGVFWNATADPTVEVNDRGITELLRHQGSDVRVFRGHVIVDPDSVRNKSGGPFRVYSPFWRAVQQACPVSEPLPAPGRIPAPARFPATDTGSLASLPPATAGGLPEPIKGWNPGETGAQARLQAFLEKGLNGYADHRDRPDLARTSGLSPHLVWGEISPRQVRSQIERATFAGASPRASERLLAQIGWREFSYYLLHHNPRLGRDSFNPAFSHFPWREDETSLDAWRRGETGYPLVDAGMRELAETGWMHNRIRMVVASFLVKHLLIDWRCGLDWFDQSLLDADAANNPAGWQWVAGSGADAAPYFRIFNPVLQGRKFDPDGVYTRRWVPELAHVDARHIHAPFELSSRELMRAGVILGQTYPDPIVEHGFARQRALDALSANRAAPEQVTP